MGKTKPQGKRPPVDDRPYIVMSKHCHLCHDQMKVNKMYGFDKDFIPLFIEKKKDRVIIDQIQKAGIEIEGTPTFVCRDFSCSDAGARGPKLLIPFLTKARNGYKYTPPDPSNPAPHSSKWLPLMFIMVLVVVGVAVALEFLL